MSLENFVVHRFPNIRTVAMYVHICSICVQCIGKGIKYIHVYTWLLNVL